MIFFDTHAHLYLSDFDKDIEAVKDKAKRNHIEAVYLPAIDAETHERLISLYESDKSFFRPMMGVHPCSIKENWRDEIDAAFKLLDEHDYWLAVGEIGLDFHWDVTFKEEQKEAFKLQTEKAISKDLPIVIHSRKSTYDCIELLKPYKGKVKGIFHCFSGSVEEANEIIKLGLYIGIGGVATYKNSGLREALPQIGLEHIVLETDSPYLTPVPHRGKRNESAYIRFVADELAHIMKTGIGEVSRITSENALKVFGR